VSFGEHALAEPSDKEGEESSIVTCLGTLVGSEVQRQLHAFQSSQAIMTCWVECLASSRRKTKGLPSKSYSNCLFTLRAIVSCL